MRVYACRFLFVCVSALMFACVYACNIAGTLVHLYITYGHLLTHEVVNYQAYTRTCNGAELTIGYTPPATSKMTLKYYDSLLATCADNTTYTDSFGNKCSWSVCVCMYMYDVNTQQST